MTTLPPPQGEHRLGCLHSRLASLFKAKGWSIGSIHSLVTVYSSATLCVTDLGAEGVPRLSGLTGSLPYKQSWNAGGQELGLTLGWRGVQG